MKEKIERKLKQSEASLVVSLSTFLKTNKRVDRDQVMYYQARIRTLNEVLKEIK